MVVGEDQSLCGNHLGRASAAEKHDGILDAPLVEAVDILSADLQTSGAQVALDALQQGGQPHALVGHDQRAKGEQELEQQDAREGEVFHGPFPKEAQNRDHRAEEWILGLGKRIQDVPGLQPSDHVARYQPPLR
jgi:hypothetical protein